jgi:hypothetical protein
LRGGAREKKKEEEPEGNEKKRTLTIRRIMKIDENEENR